MLRTGVSALALGLSFALLSCSPQGSGKPASKPAVSVQKKEAAKPEKPETAKPAAKKAEARKAPAEPPKATGPELLQNGTFEQWTQGTPAGWRVSIGREDSFTDAEAERVKSAREGEFALGLALAPDGNLRIVSKSLPAEAVQPGKRLRFTGLVNATAPKQVHLLLQYSVADKTFKKRAVSNKTGEWEKIYNTFDLPENVDPESVRFSVLRAPIGEGTALVDDVSLKYVD